MTGQPFDADEPSGCLRAALWALATLIILVLMLVVLT